MLRLGSNGGIWTALSGAAIKAGAAALCLCALSFASSPAAAETRALSLYNIHTKESATIVFKRNGRYDKAGLAKLNQFLRDWRRDKPTKMDPQLMDLLWEVYQASGATQPIHVVSGYRSPETNGMLRRRSSGVAKNSQHMKGRATDFFIPGVDLAKLRAIGLRMQAGGVGFYPTSGAPFVHMDTGSVRHWPRMSRQQLVNVFPDGRTLHVPSDGKPLPGYDQALADYKARKAKGNVALASLTSPAAAFPTAAAKPQPFWKRQQPEAEPKPVVGEPIAIAAVSADDEDEAVDVPTPEPRAVGVAVASYTTEPAPLPRLSPKRPAQAAVIALAETPVPPMPIVPKPVEIIPPARLASASLTTPDFDFDTSSPAVPAALAAAMAERDQSRRGASLPISPTAVVATVNVSRPLRAQAITTAVLRDSDQANARGEMPPLLAYAPSFDETFAAGEKPAAERPHLTDLGVPVPAANPMRLASAEPTPATRSVVRPSQYHMEAPELTHTALDTQGLRLWIGTESTRQRRYALLTMPDYTQVDGLSSKPDVAYATGFNRSAAALRTDRFSGPLVAQPRMIDLTTTAMIAVR